jgi:hypothetical protein
MHFTKNTDSIFVQKFPQVAISFSNFLQNIDLMFLLPNTSLHKHIISHAQTDFHTPVNLYPPVDYTVPFYLHHLSLWVVSVIIGDSS